MELDTSPFHTTFPFPINNSMRLGFQYIFPRQSNKQSWTFDSGGTKTSRKNQDVNASVLSPEPITSLTDVLANFSKEYFDRRKLKETVLEINSRAELNGLVYNFSSVVCEWTDFVRPEKAVCNLNLMCDNLKHFQKSECSSPKILQCKYLVDSKYQNSPKSLCFTCVTFTHNEEKTVYSYLEELAQFISNSLSDITRSKCKNNECNVNVPCYILVNSTNYFEFDDNDIISSEYLNYTIEYLENSSYANFTSTLFESADSRGAAQPCKNPCRITDTHQDNLLTGWSDLQNITSLFDDAIAYQELNNESYWANATGSFGNNSLLLGNGFSPGLVPWSPDMKVLPTSADYDLSFLFLAAFILVGGGGNILVFLSVGNCRTQII